MKGYEIVRPCDRHSNETVILRKHVTKYKHMRKIMVEFLRKFENRGIKIARVNSIRITKSIKLLKFYTVPRVRWDFDILKLTARAQSINREVCDISYVWASVLRQPYKREPDTRWSQTQEGARHKIEPDIRGSQTQGGARHKREPDTRGSQTQEAARHKRQPDTRGSQTQEGARHKREPYTRGSQTQEGARHKRAADTRGSHTQEGARHIIFTV